MTAAEVSRALNLNRTVVHRLLTTLHQRGFLVRTDGRYAPGALLVRMAGRVRPELRAAAAGVMRSLAAKIGETVVLHIADGDEAVVLDQVVGTDHVVRVEHRIGSRHPLVKGASGRALLAFLDEPSVARIVGGTDNPEAAVRLLENVRQAGYAISHDELQNDVYGLAVPVGADDEPVASLAILIPGRRAGDILQYLPDLLEAAREVGGSLVESRAGTSVEQRFS
jgi:DNA-binding IclR family transcriptional regulator